MRQFSAVLALYGVIALALTACGGESSVEGATITSSDGVASLQVPDSTLPEGTQIEITPVDPPSGYDPSQGTLLGYELQPTGLEFSQPATLTFSFDIDGNPDQYPLVLVLLQGEEGQVEFLQPEIARKDSKILLSTQLEHFSRTWAWVDKKTDLYLRLRPDTLSLSVNQIGDVVVESSVGGVADFKTFTQTDRRGYFVRVNPVAEGFITVFDPDRIRCDRDTGGVIENAYDVIVTRADQDELYRDMYADFMSMLGVSISGVVSEVSPVIARMSGHVACEGGGTSSPEPDVDPNIAIAALPPIANDYGLEVKEEDESACDFKPPSGSKEAVLVSGENGFVLQLYSPFGLGITGDGEGGLSWTYAAGPVGVGESNFRLVEVIDMVREGETLTLVIEETRYTDYFPDGCKRTYTVVYTFADETILDFISSMNYSGAGDVEVEEPNLEFGDGFFTLEGQFVDMSPGQVYHVWTEVSGVDITYDLTQILPDADGRFETLVNVELPDNTFVVIQILANGVRILSTSGDAPSGE